MPTRTDHSATGGDPAFDLRFVPGGYLTDGVRLLYVAAIDGPWIQVEDAHNYRIEWRLAQDLERTRAVQPRRTN